MTKKIVVSLLVILEIISIFLLYKTRPVEDIVLEDVKLKEEEVNNNGFALMLEQDDGTYKESSSSSWPIDMVFNSELSGCIDVNGNIIEDVLSYNTSTNSVKVRVTGATYCYIYFDRDFQENSLVNYLIKNAKDSELWQSALEGDGYRYVGTDPDNYICFGTTNKSACLNNTDKYMYRIIGIFEDNDGKQHVKLIKKEAINTAYAWHSDKTIDVGWNNSDLFKELNGSYFSNNASYSYMQDSTWTDKIATWNYTMTNTKTKESGGPSYYTITTSQVYLHELNKTGKLSNIGTWENLSAKISLMYASDYQLSLGSVALDYTSTADKETLKTGWMYINNNDSNPPKGYEWTMSTYGIGSSGEKYNAWSINPNGNLIGNAFTGEYSVRPVFYLETDELYLNGSGTIDDPIILAY